MLFRSENLARPADLEIALRQLIAAILRADGAQSLEAFAGLAAAFFGFIKKQSVSILAAPPDAAAYLMHLRQAKAPDVVDDQRVGPRHVEPAFDDRRAHQDFNFAVIEFVHRLLELALSHLPVSDGRAVSGETVGKTRRDLFYVVDAIMQIVYLSASHELAENRVMRQTGIPSGGHGKDFAAPSRRSGDHGNVPNAAHRHGEASGNRRRRKRKHVQPGVRHFQPLFMFDAKTVFFVDYQQSQVFESNVVLKKAMGADQDIDTAVCRFVENFLLLFLGDHPRKQLDTNRKFADSGDAGAIMLEGQNRCRRNNRRLRAIFDSLDRRAQHNLCFAVTDVSDNETIHGPAAFHVVLDVADRPKLIDGFFVGKAFLKAFQQVAVASKSAPVGQFALGVEIQEPLRFRFDLRFRLFPCRTPALRLEAVELGNAVTVPRGEAEKFSGGDNQSFVVGEPQNDGFVILPAKIFDRCPLKLADAIFFVDDPLVLLQARLEVQRHAAIDLFLGNFVDAEKLRVGNPDLVPVLHHDAAA